MKIIVTVAETVNVADDFEIDGKSIKEQYREYDLNEWDNYAIEEAVQLGEASDSVEVVTVTIGPKRSEETIRMALAKGADRAIRVWDDTLVESQPLDVGAKARLLAAVIEAEEPDLVLAGVQTSDNAFGGTGVALAQRLGYEWAAVVNALELDTTGEIASVRRELEGGVEELTDVELPAVLTIQTGINEPRYASLRGIRQAQRKELDVLSLSDLSLEATAAESSIDVTNMYVPEGDSDVELIEGDADECAGRLVTVLHDQGVGAQ